MKRLNVVVMLIAIVFMLNANQTERITFENTWGEQGFNLDVSHQSGVEITYSIEELYFHKEIIHGEEMDVLLLPGTFLPNEEGAPNLPGGGRYIAIPQFAEAFLKVIAYETQIYTDIDLAPAPRIPLETEDGPLEYSFDTTIYNSNSLYPAQPFVLSEAMKMRGVDYVILGITPFQYNPITKELTVYTNIKLEVDFIGGNSRFGDDRLRSRWWDPILQNNLLNYEILPRIDYSTRTYGSRTEDYEYLIISPDDATFLAWADSVKHWRQEQGIRSGVVTITEVGGNTTTAIENYVDNAYDNWDIPPVAVLLLGDYGSTANTIMAPTWYGGYSPCISDNLYADVDNNELPDVIFARMTAQNETHLETMIGKVLSYERQPPVNPDFYQQPVIAGGWQTERWFILCAEIVQGYWETVQGKEPVREYAIYDGNPGSQWSTASNTAAVVNYFGPNGLGYIPQTPQNLTDWGGNATRINSDINSGAFMLVHRDHGYEDGWGEPDYSTSNLSGLYNDDLTFVFSVNCLTGKYDVGGQCFAEAFHRHTQGALGVIAASEVSYSFVNDAYVWGMWDYMWSDFDPGYGFATGPKVLPAFANASGKYYLQASGWPYNSTDKNTVYYLFHHHGDAFSTVYSEVPEDLLVAHDPVLLSGVNFFDVSADEGSFIALTLDGEILGTAEGTGYPVSIEIEPQLPGNMLTVTVTKQNYYRYIQQAQIIPPDGAYVVHDSYALNDLNGNNNGLMDYDETAFISMTVHNVGLELAEDIYVTISSDDEYVTILDDNEFFGNIEAGETFSVADAFSIQTESFLPDEHIMVFQVTCNDLVDEWISSFVVEAYAPILAVNDFEIDDFDGDNDGILDPGETAYLIVPTFNIGHSNSPSAEAYIFSSSDGLTINSDYYEIGVIEAQGNADAVFEISADPELMIGTPFSISYSAVAGDYSIAEDLNVTVGLVIEDFESGDFSSYPWEFGGNGNWTIESANPFEGDHCAKSGVVSHSQQTDLEIELYVLTDSEISFYKKVSSEATYDFLHFYIDDSEMGAWAGEVAWSQSTYPVTDGIHTFTWSYVKDGSVSNGADCAWLDYIILPPNALEAMSTINGMISADPIPDYTAANIYVGEYFTNPDETGFYTIDIPYGIYDVTVELQGYETITEEDVEIPPFETVVLDFSLNYVAPPVNLQAELTENVVTLSWEAPDSRSIERDEQRTKNPLDNDRVLLYYKIYRNFEGGNFAMLYATTQTLYQDNLEEMGEYGYYVTGLYSNNSESEPSETVYIQFTALGEEELPVATNLIGNYPNPFNPTTNISFSLKNVGKIGLHIYNVKGELVRILINEEMEPGFHTIEWDGRDQFGENVSSGLYVYKMSALDYTSVKKMIIMK